MFSCVLETSGFQERHTSTNIADKLIMLQTLFICMGCDSISSFKQIGKASFFNYFFQHACFISDSGMIGHYMRQSLATDHVGP